MSTKDLCGVIKEIREVVDSALKTQSRDIQDWKDDLECIHDLLPNDSYLDATETGSVTVPGAWVACLVCQSEVACATNRVCERTKDRLDKCDDGRPCGNTVTGCWIREDGTGGCSRRKP